MRNMLPVLAALGILTTATAPVLAADVTQAQFDKWKTELSNWGRWGKDDERGTLNLITPEKRKQAAGLVKDGFAVSLALARKRRSALMPPCVTK